MGFQVSRKRWVAKKLARHSMTLGTLISGSLLLRDLFARSPRIHALTYHRFGNSVRDPFCVDRRAFDKQMAWLAENQLAVTVADLEDFINGKKVLKSGSVLVTIDDGYRSTYTEALPILRHYHIPAIAFVSASLIVEREVYDAQKEPYMSLEELARLPENDITVGSHGCTHRSLGKMTINEAIYEAQKSKSLLESHINREVRSFAYPFGTRADFSVDTSNMLADVGYSTAFTSQHGAISGGRHRMSLPRVRVEGGEGIKTFKLVCQGAMDTWWLVDRYLWRVQQR
jgi:peptidoglycan/xylan/chitin deacetylase (PgdA/CDA1 family)